MPTVHFAWGPVGARHLAGQVSCLVVVDVLSFTTSVGVAVEAGTEVFPYRWRDAGAAAYAERMDAALAVGRGEAGPGTPWTLSPAALRAAAHTPRLVLPSPNGSTIAAQAGDATVVAASLRNSAAVARWLPGQGYGSKERPLAVVASGERWPDGSLRPALEDLLGAGAVLSALRREGGPHDLSPEAAAAAAAWDSTADPVSVLHTCESGRELHDYGFAQDVAVAAELDTSTTVPVLRDGAFREHR